MRTFSIFLFLLFLYSCYNIDKNKKKEKILFFGIDSLSVDLNTYTNLNNGVSNEIINIYGGRSLDMIISCNVINKSNSVKYVFTNKKYSSIYFIYKTLYIENETFAVLAHQNEPPFYSKIDTFLPNESKRYLIPFIGTLQGDSPVYANVLLLERNILKEDAIGGATFKEVPIPYLLSINILKNEVHLVDSTFEEVLESYKRRGYIEQ